MSRLPILRAVRRFCLECQGDSSLAVRLCADRACALWPCRLPEESASEGEESGVTPSPEERARKQRAALRAVRRHCLACAGTRGEVRACSAREGCLLWPLRFGVRPETYRAVRARFFGPKKLSLL